MTALDFSEHSLNPYASKKRIIKRVIFHGRQHGGESSVFSIANSGVPVLSPSSSEALRLEPSSTTVLVQATSIGSQSLHTAGTVTVLSLATSQPISIPTQWATVTVTLSLVPTITTTAFSGTAKGSKPTSTSADVQSAQAPQQNQTIFPTGTVAAVIMSVLFAVMMGFVLYVARKRFGFPRSSPLRKLRKDAMMARMTNAILAVEPKGFNGRQPRRTRSLLSLVTLSSFRRERSRPGSQISSLPPFSPAPASLVGEPRLSQSSSTPIASTSRRSLSKASGSVAEASSSLHAFLASGSSSESRNPKSESSRSQHPKDSWAEVPDDLDTPIFLTASPKSTAFEGPRK